VDTVSIVDARLRGGETVRVGSTTLRVERRAPSGRATFPLRTSFGRILGASTEMRRLYTLCERLAVSDIPVVIEGETGTGKEVLAESLHEEGPRHGGPFVVFDCTAVPPNLVESELFGHERGAFTGAVGSRKGMFELAHGGTLLIDEIGDLDPALQPKLLRVLERSEVKRVGADRPSPVDVRVLAATRRNLDEEVARGRFRDDLFHRLVVARAELPPLRRRRGDVGMLARHFVRQSGGDTGAIPGAVYRRWEEYAWPGNVRELRNAVARELALGDLARDDARASNEGQAPGHAEPSVADAIEEVLSAGLPFAQARERVYQEFERRYVEKLLATHGGNVARAAAASGIGRRYFQKLRAKAR
jgi:transcriptional regulator with GAF, ATPase, and Fis domain